VRERSPHDRRPARLPAHGTASKAAEGVVSRHESQGPFAPAPVGVPREAGGSVWGRGPLAGLAGVGNVNAAALGDAAFARRRVSRA